MRMAMETTTGTRGGRGHEGDDDENDNGGTKARTRMRTTKTPHRGERGEPSLSPESMEFSDPLGPWLSTKQQSTDRPRVRSRRASRRRGLRSRASRVESTAATRRARESARRLGSARGAGRLAGVAHRAPRASPRRGAGAQRGRGARSARGAQKENDERKAATPSARTRTAKVRESAHGADSPHAACMAQSRAGRGAARVASDAAPARGGRRGSFCRAERKE